MVEVRVFTSIISDRTWEAIEVERDFTLPICPRVGDAIRLLGVAPLLNVTQVGLCTCCSGIDVMVCGLVVAHKEFDASIALLRERGWMVRSRRASPFDELNRDPL